MLTVESSVMTSKMRIFLIALVDAKEIGKVAVVDVPAIQADMDSRVKFAELLLEIDLNLYKPYTAYENDKLVMDVVLNKALRYHVQHDCSRRKLRAGYWSGDL
jgi:hypothetical protein